MGPEQSKGGWSRFWLGPRLAARLALVGLGLWIVEDLVTGVGQQTTEGGLLTQFVVIESISIALGIGIVFALGNRSRGVRVTAEIAAVLIGLWALIAAAGQGAELASGSGSPWLVALPPLGATKGAAYLAAGYLDWRRGRRRSSMRPRAGPLT